MKVFKIFITLLLSNILSLLASTSNGHFALENGETYLNCLCDTHVFWQRKLHGDFEDIYIQEAVMTSFTKRFNVTSANTLMIKNIEMDDAGLYRCTADNGMGDIVALHELVVIASTMTCNSSSNEVVGLNSCDFEPTPVDFNCFVAYKGDQQPKIIWIDLSTGNTSRHPTKTRTLDDPNPPRGVRRVSSSLTFHPEMSSPSFQCSVEGLINCTNKPIEIQYAIKSNIHLHNAPNSSDHLDCSANSSVTCSYIWRLGQKVITFLRNPLVETLASSLDGQSNSTFTCSAVCHLRSQPCSIEVMSVNVRRPSDDGSTFIIILAAVLGISVFITSASLLMFILRRYIIQHDLCCYRKPTKMSEGVPLNAVCYEGEELDMIEETSLPEYVIRCAKKYTDRPAFIDPIKDEVIHYRDVERLINDVASGLYSDFQVRKEMKVGLVLPNCIQYPIIFHAVLRIGAICVPVLYSLTQENLKSCLTDSKVDLVITTSESVEKCKSLLSFLAFKILLLNKECGSNCPSLDDYFHLHDDDDNNRGSHDLPDTKRPLEVKAAISYSSGTTGQPKGCLHTHGSYMANLMQMCHPSVAMYQPGQDTTIAAVSMSHMYGQDLYFLSGMALGCTMVVMKSFSVSNYLDLAVKYKVTCAHLVPSFLLEILKSSLLDDLDLSTLTRVETKAAHLNDQVMPLFEKKLPNCRLLKGYGMTEAMCLTKERMSDDQLGTSVGTLLPGVQAKVMGIESKAILGEQIIGELYFYSPALFQGYWERPIKTFDEFGFFKSEDIGYFDKSRRLHILDRVNDRMKCGEELVYPSDIENVIMKHPKVEDVGVVGVQLNNVGEAPRAFVVKKEQDLTEDEIYNHVMDRVAPHKRLKGGVFFIECIPRLGSGKICRAKLKAMDPMNV